MKKIALLTFAALCLTGCWTSILTVAPTVEPVAPPKTVYTTTVTTPAPKQKTVTTVTVTNYNNDPCFYLDLNAVAAAFAESRSVREFEELLNSSRYMINNLDLNRDGWIDYLRVIETHRGYYHTMLIQACLAPGVFQDVATLIAERRSDVLYVEVVGDRYLYGNNYIVRPVFVKRPPLWDVFGRPAYVVWTSPYYYDYYPSYYTRPKPIYLNHYQAYVTTYMTNHHYCHSCDYPATVFYTDYTSMTRSSSRQDYSKQHPAESFEQRVTRTASSNTNGVSVRNAGQLRTEVNRAAAKEKETENTNTRTATSTTGTSARSTSTSSSSASKTSASSSSTSSSSGSSGSSRSSGTTTSASASSGKSGVSSSAKTATTTSGSSARSTGTSGTAKRQPSTTVETKVNKSGTTRTTVKTTDATGRTTTVKRESSSSRSSGNTSTRSTSSSSSSRSSGSVKSSQDKTSGSSPRSTQRGR